MACLPARCVLGLAAVNRDSIVCQQVLSYIWLRTFVEMLPWWAEACVCSLPAHHARLALQLCTATGHLGQQILQTIMLRA